MIRMDKILCLWDISADMAAKMKMGRLAVLQRRGFYGNITHNTML